jgi:hypothetical protein
MHAIEEAVVVTVVGIDAGHGCHNCNTVSWKALLSGSPLNTLSLVRWCENPFSHPLHAGILSRENKAGDTIASS